ncbi:MAG: DUF4446 family protein [Veillonellaceae bacterium]|nr:DUF4446 family protein [Veillonellaceae bacterium]
MDWLNGGGGTVLLGAELALLCILVVYIMILQAKVTRLTRKYDMFMRGEDGNTLERKLAVEVRELREMTAAISSMVAEQENLSRVQHEALQHLGFVRYNAFGENGRPDSFSVTLLDGKADGLVLTSLTGMEETRLYAKRITNGQFMTRPSREEEQSLQQALRHEAEAAE